MGMRTAVLGGAFAVAALIVGVGFTGNVLRLRDDPARFGQAHDLQIELSRGGPGDVTSAFTELLRDAALDSVAREGFGAFVIGGHNVDAYSYDVLSGPSRLVLLSGRVPAASEEVALGPALAPARRPARRRGIGRHGNRRAD
jgi:hypothetical protein